MDSKECIFTCQQILVSQGITNKYFFQELTSCKNLCSFVGKDEFKKIHMQRIKLEEEHYSDLSYYK